MPISVPPAMQEYLKLYICIGILRLPFLNSLILSTPITSLLILVIFTLPVWLCYWPVPLT